MTCRMPEMYRDLSTVRHLRTAKRINGLIRVVSELSVYRSSDDFFLDRPVDKHIVFNESA